MRSLASGALAFSAAVFAANYFLPQSWLAVGAVVLAVLGALLLPARRRWLMRTEIILFSAAFGLAVFSIHTARTTIPAAALDGQTVEMRAVLLDYPDVYDEYCRAEVRLKGELPHLKALLYEENGVLAAALPGQEISLTARFRSADTRYGKEYDDYNAKGIYLTASAKSEVCLTQERSFLAALPAAVRHAIAARIHSLFPADTAPFMRSLLLGDKSELYEDLSAYTALTRAGFMHIAAVSGMHVAFLVSLIQLLAGKTRRSALFCMVLTWCFVAVTGAAPSAVRAGFMQSLLLVAPLVRRENDPVTSLSAVLALVLLQNPHAAASISLQLSFGAMAGILCFCEPLCLLLLDAFRTERLRTVLKAPLGVAACSLSVMAFTVPLTAIHFGTVSVLSPLSNLAALWAVSLCFCGGFAACVLSLVSGALGVWAAWFVSWPARYILLVARLVSKVPFALLYLEKGIAVWWLVLTYALVTLAAFTKARAAYKLLCPALLSAVAFFAMLALVKWDYSRGQGTLAVLDVGQGQSLVALSGEHSVVIDCGGGGKRQRAGETAGAYLLARGRTQLDALILTHLHADHANGVCQLMELVQVDTLIMPEKPNDDDGLLEPILSAAAAQGTEVIYISRDLRCAYGGIDLTLFAPSEAGDANERCVMCLASLGTYDMLTTADAPMEAEDELVTRHALHDVELYVVGHHGSKYSTGTALLESIGADSAVISVGYNNYGHPTHQVIERLCAYGCTIYRTDVNGSVEIRVG